MPVWELNYMKKLASIVTSNGGRILEIGFGLGLSTGFIQDANHIEKHIIIEPHPEIIEFANEKFPDALSTGRMEIVPGFWEDVVPLFEAESFDGILFDTCLLAPEQEIGEISSINFFMEATREFSVEAYRLLKKGGIFTFYNPERLNLSDAKRKILLNSGFSSIDIEVVEVNNAPEDCKHWRYNTFVAPIIHK